MIMFVFYEQVFAFGADGFLAHAASVCNILCEAALAKWMVLVYNVFLASKRDIAVVTSKMLYVP